jgi:uncharacterized lipoprotein YmbA
MKRIHAVYAILLCLGLLLAACGSVPPAPVDHFYRLRPVSLASAAPVLPGAIAVQPFRADSLYAERAIVYSDAADLRQLRQYHYQLWLYPPAQMTQEHFTASIGSALDLSGGSTAANVLDARIVAFERVLSGKSSKAVVALEFRLLAGGKPLLNKTYQAEQTAVDESLSAFSAAMETALGRIYAEFVADLGRRR